jgi:hypothetical protein
MPTERTSSGGAVAAAPAHMADLYDDGGEGPSGPVPTPVAGPRATALGRYLEPNTRSYRAVSPAFWNLTNWPSR